MATYDKLIKDLDPFQEGNDADIEIELDSNFPIDDVSDITFQAKKADGTIVMQDVKNGGTITLTDDFNDEGDPIKLLRVPIPASSTIGKIGESAYEIDVKNIAGNPFITIGGKFIISKQINTL
jgi:hypothetical protein